MCCCGVIPTRVRWERGPTDWGGSPSSSPPATTAVAPFPEHSTAERGRGGEGVIPDRKRTLNTNMAVPEGLPPCVGWGWKRLAGGGGRGGLSAEATAAEAQPSLHNSRPGDHPPTTGASSHGQKRRMDAAVGCLPPCGVGVWLCGGWGGEEERERQSRGHWPSHCSRAALTGTRDITPLLTHTDTIGCTHMNLRGGCFGCGHAFRGFGVVAAEERQRGLKEGATGSRASHRRGGGATGDHRA